MGLDTPWIRTCQECGHRQKMKSPDGQKSDSWRDVKCRRCQSPALDYGSPENSDPEEDAP